jgi:hypothetical protein
MHFFLLIVYFMFTMTDKYILCARVFCIQDIYKVASLTHYKFSQTLTHSRLLGTQELYKQGHVCIVFAVTHSILAKTEVFCCTSQ